MTVNAEKTADWYAQMLMPLEKTIKLAIINRLSASLLENDEQSPTPTQSVGVWCSHKVLQSDYIPPVSPQRGGVCNPPLESKKEMNFFDGLNNSWDDGTSPEEETASIRSARTQGKTKVLYL